MNRKNIIQYNLHPAFKNFEIIDSSKLSDKITGISDEIDVLCDKFFLNVEKLNKVKIINFVNETLNPKVELLILEYKNLFLGDEKLKAAFKNAAFEALNNKKEELLLKLKQSKYRLKKLDEIGNKAFKDLQVDGLTTYKISADDIKSINKSLEFYINEVKTMSKNHPYIRNAIAIPKRGQHWKILKEHLVSSRFLEAASNFYGQDLDIKGMGLEHSTETQTWWKNCYQDLGIDTSMASYMHLDYDFGTVKAMMYLTDVKPENGAFRYIKGSHNWEKNLTYLDYLIKALEVWEYPKIAPIPNNQYYYRAIMNSVEGRKLFISQPKCLQRLSHFGDDLVSEMPAYKEIMDRESTFTSDVANFIFFTGAYGIHRGSHVEKGERIGIQIVLSSKYNLFQRATQFLRRFVGKTISAIGTDKLNILIQKKTGQVL